MGWDKVVVNIYKNIFFLFQIFSSRNTFNHKQPAKFYGSAFECFFVKGLNKTESLQSRRAK